MLKPACV